ncbi:MAG: hypothetical protein K6A05_05880 [Lachnospiraceae bacterium]|nr:hypothetical protein [Lachnospiraceae bacterium]
MGRLEEPTIEEMREKVFRAIEAKDLQTGEIHTLAELEEKYGRKINATDEEVKRVYDKLVEATDKMLNRMLFGEPLTVNEETLEEYCGDPKPPANPNPVYVPKHIQRREKWRYGK